MSNKFEPLMPDEVVSVEPSKKILLAHPIFKFSELKQALTHLIKSYDSNASNGWGDEKVKWFNEEGINVQVLRYGAAGWQKGRIRISVEFCPDEPEVQKTSNQPETSEIESPLDDIRRMQG